MGSETMFSFVCVFPDGILEKSFPIYSKETIFAVFLLRCNLFASANLLFHSKKEDISKGEFCGNPIVSDEVCARYVEKW